MAQRAMRFSMTYSARLIQILALITEKCVDIDVEIVIEDSGEVKIEEDADRLKESEIFQLDDLPDVV